MAPSPGASVRIYFFERPDGSKIHVDEKAAWAMYSRPQQTITGPVRYKYIGTTDGSLYARAIDEANALFKEGGLEPAQAHLRAAFQAELDRAPMDRTLPPNFDEIDKTGRPVDMRTLK